MGSLSVAFPRNPKWVDLASSEITVKIWDTAIGKCLEIHEGYRCSDISFDIIGLYLYNRAGIILVTIYFASQVMLATPLVASGR
jgi:hypothetical protein